MARRYFKKRTQRMSTLLFSLRENKFHIFKPPCNALVIDNTRLHMLGSCVHAQVVLNEADDKLQVIRCASARKGGSTSP